MIVCKRLGICLSCLLAAPCAAQNTTSWTLNKRIIGWWDDKKNWSNDVPDQTKDAEVDVGRGAAIDKGYHARAKTLKIGVLGPGHVELVPGAVWGRRWDVLPWKPGFGDWIAFPAKLEVGTKIQIGEFAKGTLLTAGTVYCPTIDVGVGARGDMGQSDGVVAKDATLAKVSLYIGTTPGGDGAYHIRGGQLHADPNVGNDPGAKGFFFHSGGGVRAGVVSVSRHGPGTYEQTGGDLTCDWMHIPWGNDRGRFEQRGGTVTVRKSLFIGPPPSVNREATGRLAIRDAPPRAQFQVLESLHLSSSNEGGVGELRLLNGAVLKVPTLDATEGGLLGPINGRIVAVDIGKSTLVKLGNNAIVDPGEEEWMIGTCTIDGDLQCTGSPRFNIDVLNTGQDGWDRIVVTRKATLAGTVVVTPVGPEPRAGDRFTFLSAAEIVGKFDGVAAPCLSGLFWTLEQNATSVTLVVTAGPCKADCDQNGCLEPADFECFYERWQAQDPYADVDGDGFFTVNDLLAFQHAFTYGCTW